MSLSLLDNNTKSPAKFTKKKNYEKYFTLKHRKDNMESEYVESEQNPHLGSREIGHWTRYHHYHAIITIYARYRNEYRVHEFLSNNPLKITSPIEDVIQATSLILTADSNDVISDIQI